MHRETSAFVLSLAETRTDARQGSVLPGHFAWKAAGGRTECPGAAGDAPTPGCACWAGRGRPTPWAPVSAKDCHEPCPRAAAASARASARESCVGRAPSSGTTRVWGRPVGPLPRWLRLVVAQGGQLPPTPVHGAGPGEGRAHSTPPPLFSGREASWTPADAVQAVAARPGGRERPCLQPEGGLSSALSLLGGARGVASHEAVCTALGQQPCPARSELCGDVLPGPSTLCRLGGSEAPEEGAAQSDSLPWGLVWSVAAGPTAPGGHLVTEALCIPPVPDGAPEDPAVPHRGGPEAAGAEPRRRGAVHQGQRCVRAAGPAPTAPGVSGLRGQGPATAGPTAPVGTMGRVRAVVHRLLRFGRIATHVWCADEALALRRGPRKRPGGQPARAAHRPRSLPQRCWTRTRTSEWMRRLCGSSRRWASPRAEP